jgi:hypothetical protein
MDGCYKDVAACREFIALFGESVRDSAERFFTALDREGRLSSADVCRVLGCEPKTIGARLTRWIRQRARELNCSLPYDGGLGEEYYGGIRRPRPGDDPQVTYYEDRDGIARMMVEALRS